MVMFLFFLVKLMSLVSTLRDSRDMRWSITGHDMSCGFTLGVFSSHRHACYSHEKIPK